MRNLFLSFLVAISMTGCAYHGVVPNLSFSPSFDSKKIKASIYYIENSGQIHPIQIAQGQTTYDIRTNQAIDKAFISLLQSHFSQVSSKPADAQFTAEPCFISRLRHLDSHGNAFIDVTLRLTISDAYTGAKLHVLETSDSISYTPPVSATIMQLLTGLSCFILSPITIPSMVHLAGNKAVDTAWKAMPSMVEQIDKDIQLRHQQLSDYIAEHPYSQPQVNSSKPAGYGTGFFISSNGLFVTNNHVIKDAKKITVRIHNNIYDATVVKSDGVNDLAILRVNGLTFHYLNLISSKDVKLGEKVFTIGYPNPQIQGFNPKLTRGDINSLSGALDDACRFQISCPVQPGNSGGALVNEKGEVIGIVCGKLKDSLCIKTSGTLPQNVNYAIKSSYLLALIEGIDGYSQHQPNDSDAGTAETKAENASGQVIIY